MDKLTFGNSGHSRDQVATIASRDGVRHLAAAAHHSPGGWLSLAALALLLLAAACYALAAIQRRRGR